MTSTSPVRDVRLDLGLTQVDLARELQKETRFTVTRQDVNKMEAGANTPKCRQLEIEALKILARQKQELNDAMNVLRG